MAQFTDITPTMWDKIIEAFGGNDTFLKRADLDNFLTQFRNSLLNPATIKEAEISSGTISVPRTERLMYLSVDTEGLTATDFLDEIDLTGYSDFDEIYIEATSPARVPVLRDVTISATGNLMLHSSYFNLVGNRGFIKFIKVGNYAIEVERGQRQDDRLNTGIETFTEATRTVDSGGDLDISDYSLLRVDGIVQGEVLSTGKILIGTPGIEGSVIAYVDEGEGIFVIGAAAWSGVFTEDEIRTALADNINLLTGTTGYTAINDGAHVVVSAPVGSGVGADSYTLTVANTGTSVASVFSGFSGGVDGAADSCTVSSVSGGQANQMLILFNNMAAGKYLEFVTSATINLTSTKRIKLDGGAFLFGMVQEDGSITLLSNDWAQHHASLFPGQVTTTSGTFNTDVCTGAAEIVVSEIVFYDFTAGADTVIQGSFFLPINYDTSTDVIIDIFGVSSGAGDAVWNVGALQLILGTYPGAGMQYETTTVAVGGAGNFFNGSITLPQSTFAFVGGYQVFFVLYRNGTNGSDTAGGQYLSEVAGIFDTLKMN